MLHKEMQIGLIQLADAAAQFLPPKWLSLSFFVCAACVDIYRHPTLSIYTSIIQTFVAFARPSVLMARLGLGLLFGVRPLRGEREGDESHQSRKCVRASAGVLLHLSQLFFFSLMEDQGIEKSSPSLSLLGHFRDNTHHKSAGALYRLTAYNSL